MIRKLLYLSLVFTLCHGHTKDNEFRFDYTFSEQANGWLKLHEVPGTWSDARLRCHAEGAVLASPLTDQLRSAILEYVRDVNVVTPNTIYTGVNAIFSKGDYSSVEGVPLTKLSTKWAPGEPDNIANSENCIAMLTTDSGSIKDVNCTNIFPYVCYKKKNQALMINECGTIDSGYKIDERTGSCYKFHRRGLSWSVAYMTCVAEGGHLIIINSDIESQVLKELYAKHPDNTIFAQFQYLWIGMYDAKDGGYFMTIHGETLTEAGFDRWQPGEPNRFNEEDCGVTHRSNGLLYDAPCHWLLPFICEKKPDSLL